MNKNFLDTIFNLENKIVVVTGSNGQLGSVIGEYFKKAGSIVIGLDLGQNIVQDNFDSYYEMDVVDSQKVKDVFNAFFREYGRIDIIINNAGVSTFEPFEDRPEEKLDWVMDVNLKGTFNCIQNYVAQYDKYSQKIGSIINIASMYGVISPDFRIYTDSNRKNSEIYGATKAGIIQMSKYFAVHLADRNIRVNCVSPGGIFNQKNPQGADFIKNFSFRCPMKRMANQEEIMGAILYLASDAASYTTGQNITIDGGMTSW